MNVQKHYYVIAAVRTTEELQTALNADISMIFDLRPNILTLKNIVSAAHRAKKKLFVHMDLAEGIGKDRAGIRFAKAMGVDGIISTRVNIIKTAREEGLFTVQRFFVVDSQSINTTLEAIKISRPDMMEIMPGVMEKVIVQLKNQTPTPIIAGGLVDNREEIGSAIEAGATAVSTGKQELWCEE